jgi:hypothetical protein
MSPTPGTSAGLVPSPSRQGARYAALLTFCLAAPLLIAFRAYIPGGISWLASLGLAMLTQDRAFQRRLAVLLGCIALLTLAPINTDTSGPHFLALGIPFFLVIAVPEFILSRTDPGVLRFRLWPRTFRWRDLGYVLVSVPLSWLAFHLYFGIANPEVPGHWFLPPHPSAESAWRLFIGINCVGIWDELFFVNTVYAVLRSLFPYRIANAGQAVVYTTVLFHMAFTGIGPAIIYVFALTQGSIFEDSENLLYVLIVHLIVDAFLFAGILAHYYPGVPLLHF